MNINEATELLSGLWEKLSSNWWILVPAFSAISSGYHYFRKRTTFQNIFGFPWPKNDQEREMTAQVAEHKLSMLRWQAEQPEHSGAKNAVRELEKAEELLASAGYREYIDGLPDEDEDDDEDDEEDTEDDKTGDDDEDETVEEEDEAHA